MNNTTPAKKSGSASHSQTYYHFVDYYDRFFGAVYEKRIHDTIRSLKLPSGAKILEVGIGTGFSLPAYPPDVSVVGVDLSDSMLDKARERAKTIKHIEVELLQMNALDLAFESESFDYVMAFHLVSVVDDVAGLMRELHRVCKNNGKLVIINHFRSARWWVAPFVDLVSPVTRKLGWRTTLRREEVYTSIPLEIESEYKTSPASLFTIAIGKRK